MPTPAHLYYGQPPSRSLLPHRSVLQPFLHHARERSAAPFLTAVVGSDVRTHLSYGNAARTVMGQAAYLAAEAGLGPGVAAAVPMRNDAFSVLALLSVLATGSTALVVPADGPQERADLQIVAVRCACVVVPAGDGRSWAAPALAPRSTGVGGHDLPRHLLEADAPGLIIFTTGSTASAKGVVQGHYGVAVDCHALVRHHRLTGADRLLCCLPLHHVNGLEFTVFATMTAGGHVIVADRFNPVTYPRLVERFRPRIASVVPSILASLSNLRRQADLGSLEYFVSAAAPLRAETARRVLEVYGKRVVQGYGLTETTNFATTMPTDLAGDAYRRWMLRTDPPPVGQALFGNEVAVMDGAGRVLGAGETGEVVIRGHSVMLGYFDAPAVTAEAFRGGWFHSGDLGRWVVDDVSGRRFLVLTGRLKNIVKVGGEGVSLEEVDRLLLDHPGVDDAACFGVPDPAGGERVVCLVVPHAGRVAPDELRTHLARLLPAGHLPSEFVFTQQVERTPTGKVLRHRLSAAYQAGAPGLAR